MNARPFPSAAALTIITGRADDEAAAVAAIRLTEHITATPLMLHKTVLCWRMPAATRAARAWLLDLFPDLGGAAPDAMVLVPQIPAGAPARRDPRDSDYPKAA